MTALKARRHRLVAQLLLAHAVTSQAELATLLRARGERVTQATLSRDLDELGAFKARLQNGSVAYRLPDEPPGDAEHLRRMLVEFVTAFDASGPMVVLRTPPGCAHPVARALDTARLKDVIGTLAGDDTVLVVCREGATGRALARRLESMAGGLATKREA